jgi:hypothetical protein
MNEYLRKVLTGAAIAIAGAILTYLEMSVFPSLAKDYPTWAPILTALNSSVIQALRKWLSALQDTKANG